MCGKNITSRSHTRCSLFHRGIEDAWGEASPGSSTRCFQSATTHGGLRDELGDDWLPVSFSVVSRADSGPFRTCDGLMLLSRPASWCRACMRLKAIPTEDLPPA